MGCLKFELNSSNPHREFSGKHSVEIEIEHYFPVKNLYLIVFLIGLQVSGAASSYATSSVPRLGMKMIRLANTAPNSYKSFEEALAHCQKGGYADKNIVEGVAKKNALLKVQIENNPFIDSASLTAIAGVSIAFDGNEIRVIYFGGGGGNLYTISRSMLNPRIKLCWNVVEIPAMVEAVKFLEIDELNFFEDIQSAVNGLGRVDLVLTSGALQCCKDPYISLQNLISIQAQNLYITRTSFSPSSETFISIQKSLLSENGPSLLPSEFADKVVFYPNVFIPQNLVEATLRSTYNIVFQSQELKDVYRVGKVSINMYGYFCKRQD